MKIESSEELNKICHKLVGEQHYESAGLFAIASQIALANELHIHENGLNVDEMPSQKEKD